MMHGSDILACDSFCCHRYIRYGGIVKGCLYSITVGTLRGYFGTAWTEDLIFSPLRHLVLSRLLFRTNASTTLALGLAINLNTQLWDNDTFAPFSKLPHTCAYARAKALVALLGRRNIPFEKFNPYHMLTDEGVAWTYRNSPHRIAFRRLLLQLVLPTACSIAEDYARRMRFLKRRAIDVTERPSQLMSSEDVNFAQVWKYGKRNTDANNDYMFTYC